ncbi:Synaptotagmin-12 [Dufourea novaeangliae]|uniref:Synaptotagmin-12 n=1 Tax=Dufourea novaeangliae TaxID=178035 RepID=A0A154P8B2_DUFNO|nr:Synaptotagmin-12 [Dufourea novaeangliae]
MTLGWGSSNKVEVARLAGLIGFLVGLRFGTKKDGLDTHRSWGGFGHCRRGWRSPGALQKVGLVKAQYPPAQTIPGLYRQTRNASEHLLHSDSDLRLDAQGAFTRFESVDRDLHPPLSTASSAIPPQPLRPAPQPRPTARPRPSPLQTSSTVDYRRMQESGPGPLTPPPPLQRPSVPSRSSGPSVFLFQTPSIQNYGLHGTSNQASFRYEDDDRANTIAESMHMDSRLRYELEEERRNEKRCNNPYRQFDGNVEPSTRIRYSVHGSPMTTMDDKDDEDSNMSYGSYDIVQRSHMLRQHARNDTRVSPSGYGMTSSTNAASQTIIEPMYGPAALSKMLQSTQSLGNDLDRKSNETQSIEMTPFRSYSLQDDIDTSYLGRESQGLQKVSQYIRSLPDLPIYDSMNELELHQNQDHVMYDDDTIAEPINGMNFNSDSTPSPVPPPPPAPPDPLQDVPKKDGQTTGERIFNALRLVTSQGYMDGSKFYNSILSSPQPMQRFSFSSRFPSLIDDSINSQLQNDIQDIYGENDSDVIGLDGSKRSSDLYSPELNLEAQRTAQEVYNSLQNPPSSPLLLKDHSPEIYAYETDPSFTRTSEDILNSIEQRRKSMERQNVIFSELSELEDAHAMRMRSSQEFPSVLDDMPLTQRSSQEAFITNYTMTVYNGFSPGSRRGSQGPEPEPPPDDSNLKRALSCESVCSDTSIVIDDLEQALVVGQVCVGVEYDSCRGAENEFNVARVSVLEAKDLVTPDGQRAQNTYARVCLLPDRHQYQRTRLYKGTSSPSYQENFLIGLRGDPTGRTLLIEVFSSMDGEDILIGTATFQFGPIPRAPATTWLPLAGSPTPRLGELRFSLSYLPTAERLTLVVVKAKNLRGISSVPGDFFVKVYLLQQGKKTHKKRTSVKKGENSPIFNEAIIFNVPTHILQNIQLRLTVAQMNSDQSVSSKPYSVGHIIVGPTSTGRAYEHWVQMLAKVRHRVTKWHPLRK